ncbi:hypothetical protein M199_gp141 [Halogranum tailed virus 1]|uniref:Uncharacterized protein n=1 Tax=Halogranum tailed virus 1 TaxID=1273749 RepID=R4T9C9_9CAUD|nr:hypothetical protein M199_gp141 [Halogranum tailed virus 1]AGM11525.1 hypothetical protein HGTV1_228 [Halogranum tailed virus 1]
MGETYQEKVDEALSPERLADLKPSTEELFENTYRATVWYNECVWTAAALFVQSADDSDMFRRAFLTEAQVSKQVGDMQVEVDAWRDTMAKECPELYEDLNAIGLSAFQGGSAEQVARKVIRGSEDLSSNHPNN